MRAYVLAWFVTACARSAAVAVDASTPQPIIVEDAAIAATPIVDASTTDVFDAADASDVFVRITQIGNPRGGGWDPLVGRDEVARKTPDAIVQVVAIGEPRVDRTVANFLSSGRACYRAALERDPTLAGKATFTVKLAANGDVDSVTEKPGATIISAEVLTCVRSKIARTTFDALIPPPTFDLAWTFSFAVKDP